MENLFMAGNILDLNFLPSISKVMTSLKVLSLQNCGLSSSLPIPGLCELKNIQELNIKGNGHGGDLPWCLVNLTSLRLLDVSSNHFTGNIARSPLINLTTLEFLALSDNYLEIPISFKSFFNHSNLKFIDSLNNELLMEEDFLGSTPNFQLIGLCLSNSERNGHTGAFPRFLYHQHDLVVLELSRTDLTGMFPNWLLENNTRMESLLLPHNSLGGPFQLPSRPMTKLSALDISNNHFSGFIPHETANCFPGLKFLNMSSNDFEGNIPFSFGDMTSLSVLDLSNNRLSGEIPMHLALGCRLLQVLKLSNNNLEGPILPHQNNLTFLGWLHLDGNGFTEIPQNLSRSPLLELNVSHNQLSGRIPQWIGQMRLLELLDMSSNHLEGPIPTEFCQINLLFILDLSENSITEPIPSCFNLLYMQYVQLSKNRLSGPFPVAFNNTSLRMLDLSENQLSGNIPDWIGNLFELTILFLKKNRFEGNIPHQLCHLSQLTMIDLSFNDLVGRIPPCLSNITFKEIPRKSFLFRTFFLSFTVPFELLPDLRLAEKSEENRMSESFDRSLGQVEFETKGMSLSYKGVVLDLFSGIDLSHNRLTGPIPLEIGNLSQLKALNLSHNNLTGRIPSTFSNLKNIESLDLSYNHLDGKIPSQLTQLYSLEVFNLSYNNLSGSAPQRVAQFGTFDSSSYVGNPLLCGVPLPRKCNATDSPPVINASEEDSAGFTDMDAFYVSFAGSYVTMVLATVFILYINTYWRRAWFHLVEVVITSCYYFVVDNLQKFRRT